MSWKHHRTQETYRLTGRKASYVVADVSGEWRTRIEFGDDIYIQPLMRYYPTADEAKAHLEGIIALIEGEPIPNLAPQSPKE